jgi:C4-dicarboxylate-specific signal transduction histidine kinase
MRFAVAGELASALAHELNQPITALVSYLQAAEILANGSTSSDDRLNPTLTKATREAIRASAVLRRLRDFYQSGAHKSEPVDVPALCATVANAFQDRLRRAGASLGVAVDASIPQLEGDATQLEVVLHNLVANALDAVAQSPRQRRIELTVSHAEGTVTLRVDDSGAGIPAEMCSRLFEPFVTSKTDGMGLGLAISRSLIRARGGELSFASNTALRGASFIIVLPVAVPDAARVA